MFLSKEGVPSWSTPDTSNQSSVRQHSEGKGIEGNVILVQAILTYHKVNIPHLYMHGCVCLYVCLYVNSTCWPGNLQIIFPPFLCFAAILFRGQTLNILCYGVCCSYSYIRGRTQKYVNWEPNLNFLKVWDVSISRIFFKGSVIPRSGPAAKIGFTSKSLY